MSDWQTHLEVLEVLWPSLLTALAVGIAGGMVGLLVLLRQEAMMALALPPVVAVGTAVGLRMGWPTLPPGIVAVIAALLLLVSFGRNRGSANLLPALYVAGLSLSFLVIANSGHHYTHMEHLFTGADVMVTPETARVAAPALLIVGTLCAAFWRRWLLIAQMPDVARIGGRSPARWNGFFLCLLAVLVVAGTNAMGTVMVLAMLFLPVATVLPWTRRLPDGLAASALVAVILVLLGWTLSIENEWPFSQSVGGVGFALVVLSHLVALLRR